MGAQTKDMVDTRWALTWEKVDGKKAAGARFLAKGYQDPDLRDGNVDIAGCISSRSPRLQLISARALGNLKICSLVSKNALL